MRLWSLHPRYLDPKGLVALWREALLAQAVLQGLTVGYRNHPQLERFKQQAHPLEAIGAYLMAVQAEATLRGYAFDGSRIACRAEAPLIPVTEAQLAFEWRHLQAKLAARSPQWGEQWQATDFPDCHPLFRVRPGEIEPWERPRT